jgi:hypothetical protein
MALENLLENLGERIEKLESRVEQLEGRLAEQGTETAPKKRGWRWFVGIFADSPDFDEVMRIGQEWRNADRPQDEEGRAA